MGYADGEWKWREGGDGDEVGVERRLGGDVEEGGGAERGGGWMGGGNDGQ